MVGKTDQEQIEDLKQWWEKHGKVILVGVVFLISGVIGGQVWMDFQESSKARVSGEFSLVMQELQNGDADAAAQRASALIEKNSESSYASLAALALAKVEVEKGELDNAQLRLQWAAEHSELAALKAVAKLRLAKVMLAQGEIDAALAQLDGNVPASFNAAYAVARGDAYAQKGDTAAARTAYQSALDDKELATQLRGLVQMKLDSLGQVAAS